MIEAVIFDMDGVLIDSENHWQRTERNIFAKLGIELTEVSDKMCANGAVQVMSCLLCNDYEARMEHERIEGQSAQREPVAWGLMGNLDRLDQVAIAILMLLPREPE